MHQLQDEGIKWEDFRMQVPSDTTFLFIFPVALFSELPQWFNLIKASSEVKDGGRSPLIHVLGSVEGALRRGRESWVKGSDRRRRHAVWAVSPPISASAINTSHFWWMGSVTVCAARRIGDVSGRNETELYRMCVYFSPEFMGNR